MVQICLEDMLLICCRVEQDLSNHSMRAVNELIQSMAEVSRDEAIFTMRSLMILRQCASKPSMMVSHLQQPDDFGTRLASAKGDNVSTNGIVQEGALVLVGLFIVSTKWEMRHQRQLTFGRTVAISWLPVTDKARSTIIALRALEGDVDECKRLLPTVRHTSWPVRTSSL